MQRAVLSGRSFDALLQHSGNSKEPRYPRSSPCSALRVQVAGALEHDERGERLATSLARTRARLRGLTRHEERERAEHERAVQAFDAMNETLHTVRCRGEVIQVLCGVWGGVFGATGAAKSRFQL